MREADVRGLAPGGGGGSGDGAAAAVTQGLIAAPILAQLHLSAADHTAGVQEEFGWLTAAAVELNSCTDAATGQASSA